MNLLRPIESRFAGPAALLAAGALALAGCGGGYSPNENFARCTLEEVIGQQPVDLSKGPVDFPQNGSFNKAFINKLKQAVRLSPAILIDTAKRIHPDPSSPDNSLLHGQWDKAHNTHGPDSGDAINNPGDILCKASPLGAPNSNKREVYYDADGQRLLALVETNLNRLEKRAS